MIKIIKIAIATFLTFICISTAFAQVGNSLWKLSASNVVPVTTSWGIQIPSLGAGGNPCVIVGATGIFSTQACGGGGSGAATSTNPLMATYIVSTSTTATSTFNYGINLLAGCFAINGTCVGSGVGTVTSVTGTWPIISSGGNTPNITFGGLSTSTSAVVGNIPYFSGVNTFANVATSTLTASSPLTGSFVYIGSGGALGIQAAGNTQNGYLSGPDFQLLHTATTTFSAPLVYTLSTNAVTCATCNTSSLSGSGSVNTLAFWSSINNLSATSAPTVNYIIASSTTSSQLPYASTTYITSVTASTTNLTIGALTGNLQAINGVVSATSTLSTFYGGTGNTTYAVGDIIYANTTGSLAKLADVATGNALISGGTNTAPSYGKIALGTAISGTLPIANGGTNITSIPSLSTLWFDGTSVLATSSNPLTVGSIISTSTATSTFAGGIKINGGGLTLATANCSALTNNGKLTTDSSGDVICASDVSGGGSGGGTWSTTTSQVSGQLINYPNNTTDIVVVGGNSTSTGKFIVDPNLASTCGGGPCTGIGTSTPYATLSVVGQTVAAYYTATTSSASNFPYASTTMISATTASSSNYFGGNLASCNAGSSALTWNAGVFGCNTISGSGTVNSGNALALTWYAAGGTTVSATGTTLTVGSVIATTTLASQLPYASTTYITASTASTTNLTVGSLTGVLKASTGVVSAITNGSSGNVLALNGTTPTWVATTTFSTGLTYLNGNVTNSGVTSLIAGGNITVSGATGDITVASNGPVATSTNETAGRLSYWTTTSGTPARLGDMATGTASCTTGVSCNSFTVIGSSPSITSTLGTSVDLGSEVTGTLPIANGGTNITSIPSLNILWFDGTSINSTSSNPLTIGSLVSTTTATSTFIGNLQAATTTIIDIIETGGATSTFVNGINLSGGCFAINSVCVGGGAGGSGYSTVQDEGSSLTQRSTLNFIGAGVSCADDGSSKTNCTITSGTTPTATTTTTMDIDCNMPQTDSTDFAPGGSYWTSVGNGPGAWDFSDATSSSVFCQVVIPKNINAIPHALFIPYLTATSSAGVTVWNVEATTTDNNQNWIPTAWTVLLNASTTAASRMALTTSANYVLNSTTTINLNSLTLTGGQTLLFRLRRYGADANDTINNDVYMPKAVFQFEENIN